MRYIELTVRVPASDVEAAADVLRASTGSGASIEHAFSQPDLDFGPRAAAGLSAVRVYVPADADRGDVVLAARQALSRAEIRSKLEARVVVDEDWAEAWKEHFQVERYGERVVVVPSWRTYDPQPGDVTFTLDPGMAFGTGQHETTRMCLEALERVVTPGSRVLDVGTGSGILAIAAAKLGAGTVIALDVDPICVDAARRNAEINQAKIQVELGSLGADLPQALKRHLRCDVVVANIIAGAIVELAPDLAEALDAAGTLIASGIIAERENLVAAALGRAGLRVVSSRAMGEWRCLQAEHAQ